MLIFDAHLDLAMNALDWNRDLTRSVEEIRGLESEMEGKGRGCGTVAFPEMKRGKVALSLGTVIARIDRPGNPRPGYNSPEIAYAAACGQRAYYQILKRKGIMSIITNRKELKRHVRDWEDAEQARDLPLGIILATEGADPVTTPSQLEHWWELGLRVLGLTHYGISTYAHGTGTLGGLREPAAELLEEMERLGIILDLSHLSDQSFKEALELYSGPVLASHNNCRSLVPGDRQFSDSQIKQIIGRGGVVGVALDAWMLYPGWEKGKTSNKVVDLSSVVDHIDHICQIAGNACHAGIGSDLDGGYGQEQTPHDLDNISELQRIGSLLENRGYTRKDIEKIMYKNFLQLFLDAWS